MQTLLIFIDGETPADLALALRETLAQVEAGRAAGDGLKPDNSFHFRVREAAGKPRLPQLSERRAPQNIS